MKTEQLPDNIKDVNDSILNEVIEYAHQCQCNGTHSSNGVYQNISTHNYKDQPCPNTFETSYSPDRPEIVYCERCYLDEIA